METKQVSVCKAVLSRLGNYEKKNLLECSTLNARERTALKLRYIDGEGVKFTAEQLGMETDAYNKMQKRAFFKLYDWLERKALLSGTTLEELY